jgi:gliding motility-associated-like protein
MKNLLLIISLLGGIPALAQLSVNWVSPSPQEHAMTVTCQLNQNCTNLSNPGNVVAAFINGECRGVAYSNVAVGSINLAFLTIHSNVSDGEVVTFKVYNSETNVVFDAMNPLTFKSQENHGSLHAPFLVTENYAPTDIALSSYLFPENLAVGSTIATLSATDNDLVNTFTFSLVAGAKENSKYSIVGNALRTNATYNFYNDAYDTIRVMVVDAKNCSYTEDIVLSIVDQNDPPSDINISLKALVDQDKPGKFVALLKAVDLDIYDQHTYSFVSCVGGNDNESFIIRNDSVFVNTIVDYGLNPTYTICVRATDLEGLYVEKSFEVPVLDQNFAPTDISFTQQIIYDQDVAGTFVGKLVTTDVDAGDTHTYSFSTCGNANGTSFFTIRNDSIFTAQRLEYALNPSFKICIRTTDYAGATFDKSFQVDVVDVNFAPTEILLSAKPLYDQSPAGTLIGILHTIDIDAQDVHVYSLGTCGGSGAQQNDQIIIRNDSIFSTSIINHDVIPVYTICIRSTDVEGLFIEHTFSIDVIDSFDPTDILVHTLTLEEGNDPHSRVSIMELVDEDEVDVFSYELVSGDGDVDNAQFYIIDNELYIAYTTNYDVKRTYQFRLRGSDAKGAYIEKSFVLTILDNVYINEPLPSVNYVSPNDDGHNDFWVIQNVEIYKDFSLKIFDQFGNVLYSKQSHYGNEWNGKLNGKALPDGNYYYIFKSETKTYKGNITIVNR